MWYIPFLRAWRAFATYSIIVVGVAIVGIAIRYSPGIRMRPDQVVGSIRLDVIATFVAFFVTILATIMGLSLATENEGHLELTWTKPVSRERYALAVFGVDAIALIAAYVVSLLAAVIVCDIWVGRQFVAPIGPVWVVVAILALPIYVYAIIAAGSASLKRSRGMVAGLFWPVTIGLTGASAVPIDIVHKIVQVINRVNPLVMFESHKGSSDALAAATPATYLLALLMTGVFLTLAILQWKRLEA